MAGETNQNPIQSGNHLGAVDSGINGGKVDKSMEVALATKLQLDLQTPQQDVTTYFTNQDFAGDFFKIGDTVSIVKPDVDSVNVQVQTINQGQDARLTPSNMNFSKQIMVIDTAMKYAFYLSDLQKVEGKWSYESLNLAAVANKMRRTHNLNTLAKILSRTAAQDELVPALDGLGTPSAPVQKATGDLIFEGVIVPMYTKLYTAGAITPEGKVSYGSNATQGQSTRAAVFVTPKVYEKLLLSRYIADRQADVGDEYVKTGVIKTIMNMDIVVEPSLDLTNAEIPAKDRVTLADAGDGCQAIVAGTRNLVTRAGKVLPPEKFRSHEFFADECHGIEIYGERVIEPKAGVVAFISL